MIDQQLIAVEPRSNALYEAAITAVGGKVAPLSSSVGALIWTDYYDVRGLERAIELNPQLQWVQLPFAGVDAFESVLQHPIRFTSAKGSYREPVAEHALMLCMALGRKLPERIRATSWGEKFAVSLYDANVVIVGAGGITDELLGLLKPFRSKVTVVRNQGAVAVPGADQTLGLEQLATVLPTAQFVILACALTPKTRGLVNSELLAKFDPAAYLVNIARGPIVVTEDLLDALAGGKLAGAGIDVTDPEPLPEGHPAWDEPRLIVTPHTADTPQIVADKFSIRLRENVCAYLGSGEWVGLVDPKLGY